MKKKAYKFSEETRSRITEIRQELIDPCDTCGGTGYTPVEDQPGSVYRCDCMVVFRYLKELVKAGIASDYWTLNLENLQIADYITQVIQMYIKNIYNAKRKGLGILMLGPNGVGKTSLMAEIGKEAIVLGYKVRYFTLTTYLNALFDKDYEKVHDMESGDFLLVDELDKRRGRIAEAVDEFLRRMFNSNKSMILGTNWEEDTISEKLGQSITSLLKRRCQFLDMEGEDYSEVIHDSYIKSLTEEYDYWNESIVKMALRREEEVYV